MRSINVNTATKRLAHIRQLNGRQTAEKARKRRMADILRRDLSYKRERAFIIRIRDPLTEKECPTKSINPFIKGAREC